MGRQLAMSRDELLTTSKVGVRGQARGRWSNAEQEVVDRVIRRKLQSEYGGLRLESRGFRQFLTALGEGGKKGRRAKDRANAREFDSDSD